MRQIQVLLVGISPILADVIRRVVAARPGTAQLHIVDIEDPGADPRGRPPAIVILGPGANPAPWTAPPRSPGTQILRLSADLATLLGPGPADSTPLTPDALADRLANIARTI